MNQKVLELFGVMIQKPPNYQLIRYHIVVIIRLPRSPIGE